MDSSGLGEVSLWQGAKLVPLAGQFTQCPRGKLSGILEDSPNPPRAAWLDLQVRTVDNTALQGPSQQSRLLSVTPGCCSPVGTSAIIAKAGVSPRTWSCQARWFSALRSRGEYRWSPQEQSSLSTPPWESTGSRLPRQQPWGHLCLEKAFCWLQPLVFPIWSVPSADQPKPFPSLSPSGAGPGPGTRRALGFNEWKIVPFLSAQVCAGESAFRASAGPEPSSPFALPWGRNSTPCLPEGGSALPGQRPPRGSFHLADPADGPLHPGLLDRTALAGGDSEEGLFLWPDSSPHPMAPSVRASRPCPHQHGGNGTGWEGN
ncbi:hypothetical protein DR999_PMT17601 [Platysternon megacephalum]|uniref:Uncharacterized protein n=1 Tax=Platysternon megacephalum TaxID=55544 RepID=A0A4D9DV69_9SAUR|nr:hypothetical protein DR999_PMT17601 [Platysternon megacephalum]